VDEHVYVSLQQDEDGYPPYEAEEIDATPLGSGRFRVDGIPVFTYGLARGDVVRVARVAGDDRLWISDVLEAGGHWTARVLPSDTKALDATAQRFQDLGCSAYATRFGMVAVDVGPDATTAVVLAALRDGRTRGEWDFDLGIDPAV
jgi:hypothetical protein